MMQLLLQYVQSFPSKSATHGPTLTTDTKAGNVGSQCWLHTLCSSFSLQTTHCCFQYVASCLWNLLSVSHSQPHPSHSASKSSHFIHVRWLVVLSTSAPSPQLHAFALGSNVKTCSTNSFRHRLVMPSRLPARTSSRLGFYFFKLFFRHFLFWFH